MLKTGYWMGLVARVQRRRRTKLLPVLVALAAAWNAVPGKLVAGSVSETTAPIVVPQERDERALPGDLRGLSSTVTSLLLTIDQKRLYFLRQQHLLLIELHHASTPEEQEQLRQLLQANRQEFLANMATFRDELRTELEDLKGKISHAEFGRILDAARTVGTADHRHRGQ